MDKKRKLTVLISAIACGVIFIVFVALGIAEIFNAAPMGKTYKASVQSEDLEENQITTYYNVTFYGGRYEFESYEIIFYKEDGKVVDKAVNELENFDGEYEISNGVATLSSFPDADNSFKIEGRALKWNGITFERGAYWLAGVYWGVGALTVVAGVTAFCIYKYFVKKRAAANELPASEK